MWHPEVISTAAARTLARLLDAGALAGFYLAGGTGLALHFGHRRSLDLDFFREDLFGEEALIGKVQTAGRMLIRSRGEQTLHADVDEVKVTFLRYPYPLLFPHGLFEGVPVADPRDIACMKLGAIAGRGLRRDFVDVYAAARTYGLRQLLDWFREKHARTSYSEVHVLKSLTYFDEAEQDPMPAMLHDVSWAAIKQFFNDQVPHLA